MSSNKEKTTINQIKASCLNNPRLLFWNLFHHARKVKLGILWSLIISPLVFLLSLLIYFLIDKEEKIYLMIPLLPILLTSFLILYIYLKGIKYLIVLRVEMNQLISSNNHQNKQIKALSLLKNNWFSLIKFKYKDELTNKEKYAKYKRKSRY